MTIKKIRNYTLKANFDIYTIMILTITEVLKSEMQLKTKVHFEI